MDDINELKAIAAMKKDVRKEKFLELKKHIENTVLSFVPEHLVPYMSAIRTNDEYIELAVGIPGKHPLHTFDLYFYKMWHDESHQFQIKCQMNFGSFGSFAIDDIVAIKYCEAIGHFASHLAEIEQMLLFSDEGRSAFAMYNAAKDDSWKADDMLRNAIEKAKAAEYEATKADILSKIAIGTKIEIAGKYGCATIREIDTITPKNVTFTNSYGKRTKKDELVDNIINNGWKIVA